MSTQTPVYTVAREILPHLPAGWTAAPRSDASEHAANDTATLHHGDGRKLFLRRIWNREGRVTIGGYLPPGAYYHKDDRLDITCSLDRKPAAIARDITARLLPAYDAAWLTACANLAAQARQERSREEIAALLSNIAGVPCHRVHGSSDRPRISWHARNGYVRTIDTDVYSGGPRVTFELTINDAEIAADLVQWLRQNL